MNISSFARNSYGTGSASGVISAGNLLMMRKPALKSTQDKLERQQKAQKQVDFFNAQKEKLKDMECATLEEIAAKLDMFHSYEEQIAAVKKQYNGEQMFHILDEARELGEKIAKAAEKSAPKTTEERKEEMVEEALGIDENKGLLDEMLDEVLEEVQQMQDEIVDETVEELDEAELEEVNTGEVELEGAASEEIDIENVSLEEGAREDKLKELYKPVDILI